MASTLFEKTPLPCHEAHSAGAQSAQCTCVCNAQAYVMIVHVLSILGVPGALCSPQLRKISGTSQMKEDKDGKSEKNKWNKKLPIVQL